MKVYFNIGDERFNPDTGRWEVTGEAFIAGEMRPYPVEKSDAMDAEADALSAQQ